MKYAQSPLCPRLDRALPTLALLCAAGLPAQAAVTLAGLDPSLPARVEQLARQSAVRLVADDAPGPARTATETRTGPRVEVELGALDPRLSLAPCQRVAPYLAPGLPAWGRTRIGLRCEQGDKLWNVTLPVTIKVWVRSLVTTDALPAGTTLQAGQLMLAEVDAAAATGSLISDASAAAGRELRRPLAAGSALRLPDLKARQWFAAGETVRVLARGTGWQIAAEGQALGPGIEGQTLRVRMESGRMVQARPIAERQVEVD